MFLNRFYEKEKRGIIIGITAALIVISISGCSIGSKSDGSLDDGESNNNQENITSTEENLDVSDNDSQIENTEDTLISNATDSNLKDIDSTADTLDFVDAFGNPYTVEINNSFPFNSYISSYFIIDGDKKDYIGDDNYTTMQGIDVSSHQGDIDWDDVAESGVEFVFIRIAYRGYGEEGKLVCDEKFESNYEGAVSAGLKVGVYFFAQAINEDEAIEEAEFVLDILDGRSLDLPIIYDPESILDDDSRTDDVTGEQFTLNTIAFCDYIKEAGYDTGYYANMLWEAYELDMSLIDVDYIWYADYEDVPQTPYEFQFWQYSESGSVDGIDGVVDLDLWIISN